MTSGLRRFVGPDAPAAGRAARQRPGERCELCAEPVGDDHSHLVDLTSRNILCACRACWLLFSRQGAGGGHYRAVPDRYLHAPSFAITPAQWDAMQIPVRMAFLFHNSSLGRVVAFYPSPAGATESLLPLDTWEEVLAANPALAGAAPDVEALLLLRDGDRFECFLVPIDACYQLVGLVRLHWKGFSGGEEAWRAIDGFFADLRGRSEAAGGLQERRSP